MVKLANSVSAVGTSKVIELKTALNTKFLERSDLIDGMLTSLLSKEPLLMLGPPGCLAGNTILSYRRGERSSSRPIELREFHAKFNGLPSTYNGQNPGSRCGSAWELETPTFLHSLFPDGSVRYNRVFRVWEAGVKQLLKMSLDNGAVLRLTADHPVATSNGEFVAAGELVVGEAVLVRGSMKPINRGGRDLKLRPMRVIIRSLKFYPNGAREEVNGYSYRRTARARLVVEAALNGVSYDDFIWCLKNDQLRSQQFHYLSVGLEVHHQDGNPMNDNLDNLQVLSHEEHSREHGAIGNFGVEYTTEAEVVAISIDGEEMTYDIQMEAPANNFCANGIIVHNTAKSMICQAICDSLSGAKFFQWMMSKFTVSEELFGPLSLKALENDAYIRQTKDKLPEADIAFLDEALALDTPIPTPTGWTLVGELQVGSQIFGRNGKPTTVKRLTPIVSDHKCYKLIFSDGETIVADAGHKWVVLGINTSSHERVFSTEQLFAMKNSANHRVAARVKIPLSAAIELPEVSLPIDPYLLGLWLGNGNSWTGELYIRNELVYATIAELFRINMKPTTLSDHNQSPAIQTLSMADTGFRTKLGDLGLIIDRNKYVGSGKRVPVEYLRASKTQRLRLLQGLMDTEGYITGNTCVFSNTNEQIVDSVVELVRSFGLRCSKDLTTDERLGVNGDPHRPCWKVTFGASSELPPFLVRKISMPSRIQRRFCHIVAIEQTPSVPVRCIEVDAEDHLFLAGNNFAVTHNCFKGSSAILNTMLTILNEKTFHNGGVTKVPLQTVYAASNEIPQAEELSAFYDRFVLRFFVEPVRDNNSIRILFSGLPTVVFPTISLKELETEQKAAAAVTISTAMVDLLIRLRREIENEGFLVSDRKWVQATRVLKAFAHLNGHITVEDTDFDILCHVLWSAPEQRSKVRKVVMRVSNPFGEKLLDIVDGVKDIESQLDSGAGDAVESFMKVKHALKALNDLGDPNLNHRLSIAIEKVRTIQAAIAKKHLGLND